MALQTPDLHTLAARLEAILDRLEMQEYASCLTLYDRAKERLRIGLQMDGSPSIQVGER